MKNDQDTSGGASNLFIAQNRDSITGTLEGFDRLRLKATLPCLYYPEAMEAYLSAKRLLWRDFKGYATNLTGKIKAAAAALAERAGRPWQYLASSAVRKETVARDIAARDGITEGLIAVLACVEPCRTYRMRGNAETKKLELKLETRQCNHFYFYRIDPVFGFMHFRLQPWFPFQVQVCLNGREWLARQMDKEGLGYVRRDNCFTQLEDARKAQQLMDSQVRLDWSRQLQRLLRENHPLAAEICRPLSLSYYWTVEASEYATDILFAERATLQRIYPRLVRHAINTFGSGDVLRFLGGRPTTQNTVCNNFAGEVQSDLKTRAEGVRVKHGINGNTIKAYDKHQQVLRIETTINRPRDFRAYRAKQNDPRGAKKWRIMRRSIADLYRRAEVSSAANGRYLSALASTGQTTPLSQDVDRVCKPVSRRGQRHRALNPWSPKDRVVMEAISRGEFAINGFRNRDIRQLLFRATKSKVQQKRRAAHVTRRLAHLRAHRLIKKVPGTHRYVVTEQGRKAITAVLAARQANVAKLTAFAA